MTKYLSDSIIQLAIKLSEKSTMRYHLSAIVFDKKHNIINTGYNRWLCQGHYNEKPLHSSIHAEEDAIIGCSRRELYNSSIFVFRKNFQNARPCYNCMKLIKNAGITKIYYSENGTVSKLTL